MFQFRKRDSFTEKYKKLLTAMVCNPIPWQHMQRKDCEGILLMTYNKQTTTMEKNELLLSINEIKAQQDNQLESIEDPIAGIEADLSEKDETEEDKNVELEYDDEDRDDYNNYLYDDDSDDRDRETFYALTDGMFGDYEDFNGDWDALDDYLGR